MSKIEFNNITTLDKDKNKFVKLIKNFNCSFETGDIVSFISEDYKSKKILTKLLIGEITPVKGELLIPEKSKTTLVSKDVIFKIQNNFMAGSSFLIENFKKNRAIDNSILNQKKHLEKQIENTTNNILIIEKSPLVSSYERSYVIEKWLSKFSKEIVSIDKENIKGFSIQKIIENYEYDFNNIWTHKNTEKKNIGNYFSSKEISILDFNKNMILEIKKYRSLELKEIKNLRNAHRATDDQQKEIYMKLKLQSEHIIKYLKELKIYGFKLDQSDFKSVLKLNSIKDQNLWLIQFDKLIDFLYKLRLSVNDEVKKEINSIITYVSNIQNYRSPVNSVSLNNVYSKTIEEIKLKLTYFDRTIFDIEKLIDSIIKKDKEEEKFQRRKLWEFQIVSLRFQKQIYNEKHTIVKRFLSSIREEFFKHTQENINDFYTELKRYEKTMLEVDLSLNNWRFQRDLKELELNIRIKKEEIIFNIEIQKEELSKITITSKKQRSKKIASLVKRYKNLSDSDIKKDKIFSKYDEGIIKISKLLKRELSVQKKELMDINQLIYNLTEEEKENQMLQLLEDISFDLEIIGNEIRTMSKGDIQRLLIVSYVMNGSNIIVIDEPQIDIKSNAKSSVQNTIKTLSKKYGITFIILTRNLKSSLEYSDVIAFVDRGTVWEYGSPKSIIKTHVHPLSKDLIDNADKIAFLREGTKFIDFDQKNLFHNQFLSLEEHKISRDHFVFCSEEEFNIWRDK